MPILYTHSIGFQVKRKELAKTFMMISNGKNPLASMVFETLKMSENVLPRCV